MRLSFCHSREQQDGCSRDRPAVRLSAQGTHRAGLAALPRLGRRDRGAVGVGAVAAGALREEHPAAAPGGRPRAVRGVLRRYLPPPLSARTQPPRTRRLTPRPAPPPPDPHRSRLPPTTLALPSIVM